ncbi:MAG: sigma factor [Trebonia sp.]
MVYQRVVRVATPRHLGVAWHAEDLAQAAFARAYASWGRVRRAGDRDAYVRRIVINAHRSRPRKRRVAEELRPDLAGAAASAGHPGSRKAARCSARWRRERGPVRVPDRPRRHPGQVDRLRRVRQEGRSRDGAGGLRLSRA